MSATVQQINEMFPVLTPAMTMEALPYTGGMEFYAGLEQRFASFAGHVLISSHTFNEPWPSWERHPSGDEFVVLLRGSATMALKIDGNTESVTLTEPGHFIIVPRGAWHIATKAHDAQMLFITPGEGTEHDESPD